MHYNLAKDGQFVIVYIYQRKVKRADVWHLPNTRISTIYVHKLKIRMK
jgi:hypothetical protein